MIADNRAIQICQNRNSIRNKVRNEQSSAGWRYWAGLENDSNSNH